MEKRAQRGLMAAVALLAALACALGTAALPRSYAATSYKVAINEIESKDADGGPDWIELYNYGDEDVDISDWTYVDSSSKSTVATFASGTVLAAGEFLVLDCTDDGGDDFTFGLGSSDAVYLYDGGGNLVDSYSWTSHANGTYARVPDGTGDFVDQDPTPGAANSTSTSDDDTDDTAGADSTVAINEVNSQPDDWVELYNYGEAAVDISGWEIRDASKNNSFKFADGTTIAAGGFIVAGEDLVGLAYDEDEGDYVEGTLTEAMGLGASDAVYLYDAEGNLVDSYSWTAHATYDGDASLASYGRYPDGTGSFCLMKETKGAANEWYAPTVAINEIESSSNDGSDNRDWVEIYNYGEAAVDISGWYILDNSYDLSDATPLADGTTLEPGEFYVLYENTDFSCGLGKADSVTLYNADGVQIDTYTWSGGHASGTYSRIPDGTGDFVDADPTCGTTNFAALSVVINEVESKDAEGGDDWIELANTSDEEIDMSGLVIKDADGNSYTIPDGTTIAAGGFLVLYQSTFDFGLGSSDGVYLYQSGVLIGSVEWSEHACVTLGLYPDVDGSEYRDTAEATPGAANVFDTPETEEWSGGATVETIDMTFLEDASGLDYYNGQLYVVDNDAGTIWILDVDLETGELSYADGCTSVGIALSGFKGSDGSDGVADAEGITVADDGTVYLAVERDNNHKGVNYDVIVAADAATGEVSAQWDITSALPDVSANYGIEAVEWASDSVAAGLVDANTGEAFDASLYENSVGGVFFVALESNGYVYAFVLNNDGTYVLIAEIDTWLGSAMALDYDEVEGVLWVVTDEACDNVAAKVTLNGTDDPDIVFVEPPAGMATTLTNEGFAIVSDAADCESRWVYRAQDGVEQALTVGTLSSAHTLVEHEQVDATCTEDGTEAYWECSVCGKLFSDADGETEIDAAVTIAATGHSYEAVVTEAACTEGGSTTYTCSVCGASYVAGETDALGHSYEASWTWAEGYSSAELTLTCARDSSHTVILEGDEVAIAVATADGTTSYTATASYDGVAYTDVQTADAVAYEVLAGADQTLYLCNLSSTSLTVEGAYGKFVSLAIDGAELVLDEDYTLVASATGSIVVSIAAEALASLSIGEHVLTVTYTDGTASTSLTVAEHAYDYAGATWIWTAAEDGSYTATATVSCKNDESQTLTVEAEVTSSTDEDGNTVYTATANLAGVAVSAELAAADTDEEGSDEDDSSTGADETDEGSAETDADADEADEDELSTGDDDAEDDSALDTEDATEDAEPEDEGSSLVSTGDGAVAAAVACAAAGCVAIAVGIGTRRRRSS